MLFYILDYVIFTDLFLFANPMQTQNLVLKIEHNERSDKQTTVNEINITFVNKTQQNNDREENSGKNKVKTSRTEYSKLNEHNKNKQEKTLRISPTQFPKPSEIISKQFKTIREDLEAIQYKHDRDVSKLNNTDTLRTIEEYSNINTNQDVGDPVNMDMVPVIQDRGDLNRIKHNLEAFSLNRKETFVATPKFSFPRPNIHETYSYSKENNYLNINPYSEIKTPNIKISPVAKLHQSNFQNNGLIRELPKFQRFSDKSNFQINVIPGEYISKRNHNNENYRRNENVSKRNDKKDNEYEKTLILTNIENEKRKNDSAKHSINRNSYRIIQNPNAINRSYMKKSVHFPKYDDNENNLSDDYNRNNEHYNDNTHRYHAKRITNFPAHKYKGELYNKENMNSNERHNLNVNCVTNQNYNNLNYRNNVKRGVNFPTPNYAAKFSKREKNNFIEKHGFNDNNYYRINQDYNDIIRNYEKRNINSAIPKYFNKQNNQLNDRHTFDDNSFNQNGKNVEYSHFHDINREKNEKKQILDVLDKQNKLIERIAHRLLRDRTIKPEEITWTDFDDIVNSLEARQNRTTSTKLTTETTTKMSTIITLIDETEIKEALKKDPFVKRILKMVDKRNGENDTKLDGSADSIVVHNS